MNSIKFSIANNAVTHLGRNLYSTTPPALAELVANSYDAYATEVDIKLSSDSISIIDNGKGLNLGELKDKYAIIGSEKQEEKPINGLPIRKPMGKKGIGKLAAFSLGDTYTVYSKAKNNKNGWLTFTLKYHEMTKSDNYDVEVSEIDLPQEFSDYKEYSSGFIVKITGIRRQITQATKNNIQKQLSRRFYIDQSKTKFKLKIDGKELKLDSNEYYKNIEYLVYFGREDKSDLKSVFKTAKYIEKYPDDGNYFQDSGINGWIGTVGRPKDLKNEDGASFANVIVLANGKIADEDILKNKSNARIANNYVVGEVMADNFINKLNDPITSSRQGLDDSISEVDEFIKELDKVRDFVINRWDEIRRKNIVDKLPERIKNNSSYKKWLDDLSEDQRKINNKLLDLFSDRLDDDTKLDAEAVNSMITSICGAINNIQADEIISGFNKVTEPDDHIDLLLKFMANIAKTEDINHADLIRKRLQAIEELEKLMKNKKASEKLFENHLSDNPWLISPYWNIDRNNPIPTDYLENQKYFKLKKDNKNFKKNFLDILIKVAEEEYPIIVELKKNTPTGHANVEFIDIYEQVTNYRKAMIQQIPELKSIEERQIKVVFILPEDTGLMGSGNTIQLSEREIEMLDGSNITILKYNKILAEAKKMYREHIDYQKKANIVPILNTKA